MNKVIFVLFKKIIIIIIIIIIHSFRPSVRAHIQVIKTSHYLKHTKDTLHILGETFILEYAEGKYNRKHQQKVWFLKRNALKLLILEF